MFLISNFSYLLFFQPHPLKTKAGIANRWDPLGPSNLYSQSTVVVTLCSPPTRLNLCFTSLNEPCKNVEPSQIVAFWLFYLIVICKLTYWAQVELFLWTESTYRRQGLINLSFMMGKALHTTGPSQFELHEALAPCDLLLIIFWNTG